MKPHEKAIAFFNAHHAAKRAHGKGLRDTGRVVKLGLMGSILVALGNFPRDLARATRARKD